MPHTINRAAFLSARTSGHPLLAAYCMLVAVELALKDADPTWRKGHNVPQLLTQQNDPGLTSLAAQLESNLQNIPCTIGPTTVSAPVRKDNYPELRYMRHVDDHADGIGNKPLLDLLNTIDDIVTQLRARTIL